MRSASLCFQPQNARRTGKKSSHPTTQHFERKNQSMETLATQESRLPSSACPPERPLRKRGTYGDAFLPAMTRANADADSCHLIRLFLERKGLRVKSSRDVKNARNFYVTDENDVVPVAVYSNGTLLVQALLCA